MKEVQYRSCTIYPCRDRGRLRNEEGPAGAEKSSFCLQG